MTGTRILVGVLILVLAVFAAAGVGLALAHRQIDAIEPELPTAAALAALDAGADSPIRVSYINTASQAMSRAAVLEPTLDTDPDAPYVMSHAAFVLEWPDGRLFLIDAGMETEAALEFGAPMELAFDSDGIVPLGSVAKKLGDRAKRVDGIAFTHLHTDHTQGIGALCVARGAAAPLPVFETPLQSEELNYTTQPGRDLVEAAACAERRRLSPAALSPVPGFPGLAVFNVAGHTPGSQVFAAHVAGQLYFFVGDLVNHAEGLRNNWPKPHLYSRFVVPENTEHLWRVRGAVKALAENLDARMLVTHDQGDIESQLQAYSPSDS